MSPAYTWVSGHLPEHGQPIKGHIPKTPDCRRRWHFIRTIFWPVSPLPLFLSCPHSCLPVPFACFSLRSVVISHVAVYSQSLKTSFPLYNHDLYHTQPHTSNMKMRSWDPCMRENNGICVSESEIKKLVRCQKVVDNALYISLRCLAQVTLLSFSESMLNSLLLV